MKLSDIKELKEMGFDNDQIVKLASGGDLDAGTQPKNQDAESPEEPDKPEEPKVKEQPDQPKKEEKSGSTPEVGQLLEEVKALKGLIQNQNRINSFIGKPDNQSSTDILCNFVNPTYKKPE